MYRRVCSALLLIMLLVMHSNACPADHALLRRQANDFIEAGQYDSAYFYSLRYFESAQTINDSACIVKAHIFLWHTATKLGRMEEALSHLQQAHIDNCASCNLDSMELNNSLTCIQNLGRQMQNAEDEHGSGFFALLSSVLFILVILLLYWSFMRNRKMKSLPEAEVSELAASSTADTVLADRHVTSASTSSSVCAPWKLDELVVQLEKLMTEQHLYREKLLTRDKVADLLGTNRTYLGQVMSEHYQKTFTQYINDLRIDEAIRILDDPDCKRPIRLIGLDLGFNSVTTFNTQFQNRTGMTPAQYRLQKSEKM